MRLRNIGITAALLLTTVTGSAAEILTTDQLNVLLIQRRQIVERQTQAMNEFILNEKKIELLLAWARGENPSTVKNKIVPAAVTGGAGLALTLYVKKHLPKILAALPPSVQNLAKYAPALAGTIAAAYVAWDTKEYSKMLEQMTEILGEVAVSGLVYVEQSPSVKAGMATAANLNPEDIKNPKPAADKPSTRKSVDDKPVTDKPATPAEDKASPDTLSTTDTKPDNTDYFDPNGPKPGIANTKMDRYYQELLIARQILNEEILLLTLQVNRLNAYLHVYE